MARLLIVSNRLPVTANALPLSSRSTTGCLRGAEREVDDLLQHVGSVEHVVVVGAGEGDATEHPAKRMAATAAMARVIVSSRAKPR